MRCGVLWWQYDKYEHPEMIGVFSDFSEVNTWLYNYYLPRVSEKCHEVGERTYTDPNGNKCIKVIRKINEFNKIETDFTFIEVELNKVIREII